MTEKREKNSDKKLPFPYDLVNLITKKGKIKGWWTGTFWWGLRLKSDEEVLGWERIHGEMH
jgi:hypothetical protein